MTAQELLTKSIGQAGKALTQIGSEEVLDWGDLNARISATLQIMNAASQVLQAETQIAVNEFQLAAAKRNEAVGKLGVVR